MKELDSGCVKESGSLRSQTVSQPPVDVSGGNHRQHKHTRKNKPTKAQANTKHHQVDTHSLVLYVKQSLFTASGSVCPRK